MIITKSPPSNTVVIEVSLEKETLEFSILERDRKMELTSYDWN